jgi:hypothetical protein
VILAAQISWSSFSGDVRLRDDKMFFRAPFPGDRIVCQGWLYELSLNLR